MSYAYRGIDTNLFHDPVFNFAFTSNDLFFQYHLLNKMIRLKQIGKIRWCILDLPYYIFNWDRSMSLSMPMCMNAYAMLEGEENQFHHLEDENIITQYYTYENMFKEKRTFNRSVTHVGEYEIRNVSTNAQNMKVSDIWNLTHKTTIRENIGYFKEILRLPYQINGDIKIYVVVFPQNPLFYKQFESIWQKAKAVFYDTLASVSQDEFEIWDYFCFYDKESNYFYDEGHLNAAGRKNFTLELVERMEKT